MYFHIPVPVPLFQIFGHNSFIIGPIFEKKIQMFRKKSSIRGPHTIRGSLNMDPKTCIISRFQCMYTYVLLYIISVL